jgi:hypothetical protein
MVNTQQQKRPSSIEVLCALSLSVIILTILLNIRGYIDYSKMQGALNTKWFLIMIFLNIPTIIGLILMFFLKRVGFWIFLLGKVLYFVLPIIAGTVDTVFGLLVLPYFIESVTFIILFATRLKYMV